MEKIGGFPTKEEMVEVEVQKILDAANSQPIIPREPVVEKLKVFIVDRMKGSMNVETVGEDGFNIQYWID
jgi:hypothetical protein